MNIKINIYIYLIIKHSRKQNPVMHILTFDRLLLMN